MPLDEPAITVTVEVRGVSAEPEGVESLLLRAARLLVAGEPDPREQVFPWVAATTEALQVAQRERYAE